jgi:hypothetical protein
MTYRNEWLDQAEYEECREMECDPVFLELQADAERWQRLQAMVAELQLYGELTLSETDA